jgi:UDP-glucose 4-epimerase
MKEIENQIGKFDYEIGPRRPGDADELCAKTDKIKKLLNWEPNYKLSDIIKTAATWHSSHPDGYK